MKDNEKNACDAFIEVLKKIKGMEYKIDELPEKKNRNTQDVEAILASTGKEVQSPRIAVEHTIVEAHNNQILYVNQLRDIAREIDRKCKEKLPTGRLFVLIAPPPLIVGTSKKSRNQFIEEMTYWILGVAKNLNTDQQSSRLYNNHTVSLSCAGPSFEPSGKVVIMPTTPSDYENESRNRFHRSIAEKLPKLLKYKEKEEKFEIALLLEDINLAHCSSRDHWCDLIPNEYHLKFQSIDYVVIFASNEERMVIGLVWKEKSQLYSRISEIPDNRRFPLWRRNS